MTVNLYIPIYSLMYLKNFKSYINILLIIIIILFNAGTCRLILVNKHILLVFTFLIFENVVSILNYLL